MLDWQTILRCHAYVAVWYWPVLWHYLARLEATAELCRAEGRGGFGWQLERDGTIWITHWPESAAERARRGALPREFDRTPWTALDPSLRAESLAALGSEAVDAIAPFLYHGCTAAVPFLHGPDTGLQTRAPP